MQKFTNHHHHHNNDYNFLHEKYDLHHINHSPFGAYSTAAVAVDSVVASQVGKTILEQNGSVVDAGIAALLCNGLLNSQSMGIGGGFFMLHYSRENEAFTVIDARETAPELSTYTMFDHHSISKGGLSIAVPGEIKGYWKAHQMFGKLKWSKLFQPAIEMCQNGYCLPHSQHKFLKMYERRTQHNNEWRETFINELKGEIYKANALMKRPKLGKTFEVIAKEGENAFYNGVLTDTIVNEVADNGGIITKADLNNYEALVKEPITYNLKSGIEIASVPPPSCGILLNFMLALLDSYDHDVNTLSDVHERTLFYHHFIEASKFAFGFREFIGDENFVDTSGIKRLLKSKDVISEYRSRISDTRVYPSVYYGSTNFTTDSGTAHLSIIGSNGDAVAFTSSINHAFGSKIIGNSTSIHYNNQMDDFAIPNYSCNAFNVPNHVNNYVQPGKRPVSSMVPTICIDREKNVRLVLGGSGGTRILTSCALVAARNLLLDDELLNCIDAHRVHNQLCPDEVLFEDGFSSDITSRLSHMGHRMQNFGHGGSAVQAIERRDNLLYAVCDKRKGGVPYGIGS